MIFYINLSKLKSLANDIEFLKRWNRPYRPSMINSSIPYYEIKATIETGGTFGEVAISYTKKRTATVVTSKETYFLTLSKAAFTRICERSSETTSYLLHLFENCFPNLSKPDLATILALAREEEIPLNAIILKQGVPPPNCFIIKSGHFKMYSEFTAKKKKKNMVDILRLDFSKKMNTKRLEVSVLSAGQFIGYKEVILNTAISYSIRAITNNAHIYRIPANLLRYTLQYHTELKDIMLGRKTLNEAFRSERVASIFTNQRETEKEITKIIPSSKRVVLENDQIKLLEANKCAEFTHTYSSSVNNKHVKTKSLILNQNLMNEAIDKNYSGGYSMKLTPRSERRANRQKVKVDDYFSLDA